MKRYPGRDILTEINNGNEEVLVYLARKYFTTARRILRMRGFRDEHTPHIFADVLAKVYSDLRHQKREHLDFESYFLGLLKSVPKNKLAEDKNVAPDQVNEAGHIVSQCVAIMEDDAQQLLFARVTEKLNYEQMKDRFQFSNAVIAQYEFDKAFNQLEGIVRLRLNIIQDQDEH